MMLVTLEQVKAHLRIVHSSDDDDLTGKIHAASALVVQYLKEGAMEFLDSSGSVEIDSAGDPVGVPDDVQVATLIMVGYLNKDRDEDPDRAYEMGYLPKPVMAMLYRKRDPACR
ncbi:head-tail connector protein [Pandoraea norimbergensis]